ncbi:MAG: hypothetical protein BAJALOKI2v1_780022, partial [Promethearchaeota archaeon]
MEMTKSRTTTMKASLPVSPSILKKNEMVIKTSLHKIYIFYNSH